jgi:hypothetical protein
MNIQRSNQVQLEPDQYQRLQEAVRLTGLSESVLLSKAIDQFIFPISSSSSILPSVLLWEEEKQFIKSLDQKEILQERDWKREDLYDRQNSA